MGLRRDIKEGDYPPKREISKKTKGVARLLNVKEECNIMSFPNSDAESKGKKKLNNKVDLLRTAKIRIEKDQAGNMYPLKISGKGEDGRCRWCRSFFTVLRRKAEREGIFLDEDWT